MITLYGIANCDTVRKARVWLDGRGTPYALHDYRKDGVPEAAVRRWVAALGLDVVLNRAGTTFRKLPEADKVEINAEKAIALMLAQPAMIRRPVVEGDGVLLAGFKPEVWEQALS